MKTNEEIFTKINHTKSDNGDRRDWFVNRLARYLPKEMAMDCNMTTENYHQYDENACLINIADRIRYINNEIGRMRNITSLNISFPELCADVWAYTNRFDNDVDRAMSEYNDYIWTNLFEKIVDAFVRHNN